MSAVPPDPDGDAARQELRPEPKELPRREGTYDSLVEEAERAPEPEEVAATAAGREGEHEGGEAR